jgi:hypothetical protein
MSFAITLWQYFFLIASLPGAENAKYAAGAGGFRHFNTQKI